MATITTQELAQELDTTGREVRKFLRSITPTDEQPGKGSRWSIPGTKRDLTRMHKQFDAWKQAQADRASAHAEESHTEEPEAPAED